MTEQNDAPEGAIPTDVDSAAEPQPDEVAEQTMIGEPLPVGAHDPEKPQPMAAPPGMPKAPDVVDEQIAAFVDAIHRDDSETYVHGNPAGVQQLRPDQATVVDAFRERLYEGPRPRSPREALLVQLQQMRAAERKAALSWSEAVRVVQEERDAFEFYRSQRYATIDALVALGMTEDDFDLVAMEDAFPHAKPREALPDDVTIV